MLCQSEQQSSEVCVLILQWLVWCFIKPFNVGAGEVVGLKPTVGYPEAPPTFDTDTQKTIGALLPVLDQCFATGQ